MSSAAILLHLYRGIGSSSLIQHELGGSLHHPSPSTGRHRNTAAAAFAQLKEWRAQALLNAESTLFLANKRALLDGAAQNRWPTVHS
jgi:hypothetical protein